MICVGNLHEQGNACFGVAKLYFQIFRLGSTYAEHPGFAQEYWHIFSHICLLLSVTHVFPPIVIMNAVIEVVKFCHLCMFSMFKTVRCVPSKRPQYALQRL